jgi:hypothetical protein
LAEQFLLVSLNLHLLLLRLLLGRFSHRCAPKKAL